MKYSRLSIREHTLLRPDTYIGSLRLRDEELFIADMKDDNIELLTIKKKVINTSPGIIRLFIEPLSNVIDNVVRSKLSKNVCSRIDINIDIINNIFSMQNNGDSIPISKNENEDMYNHSLIFGHFLTSSNYNDDEDRTDISGRNGLGIKLLNVFSKYFSVEGGCKKHNKILKQEWRNNMSDVSEPVITVNKNKKDFTKITWKLDLEKLKIKSISKDIEMLFLKYILDAAMITKVDIFYNGKKILIKSLVDYVNHYNFVNNKITKEYKSRQFIKTKNSEIIITESLEYGQISFTNGVYTDLGGSHVNAWENWLYKNILLRVNQKYKDINLKKKDIRDMFFIFLNVSVKNPTFESQSKRKLESKFTKVYPDNTDKIIKQIMKWPNFKQRIDHIIKSKEFLILKKLERKKRTYLKIDNYDPANRSGGSDSSKCTLILCEGLSAKTYAVTGISQTLFGKKGRDWFGIYPLRGKLLNVRKAKIKKIAENKIISNLIKILNLTQGKDYTNKKNYETLHYGRILILCDQDVDGIHISGLIQNFFHYLFPSLLKRKEHFVTSMQTPIVKISYNIFNKCVDEKKKQTVNFYNEEQYEKFILRDDINILSTKYYKGLGTSTNKDIKISFGKKIIMLNSDIRDITNMNKVFHKDYTQKRKEWLSEYSLNNKLIWNIDDIYQEKIYNISDFINNELIKFSIDDCKRSIPNIMDGLKESQRKVLYACFKKKLYFSKKKTLKVAQLAGYVAECTNYHHGEQNLFDTIIKLAQDFPGSNNIPLLFPDGQFGTRSYLGKDAANARYIFTKLNKLTRYIFREDDDPILTYHKDGADTIEPETYYPIIPMILVNGITGGIGTGWSCNIPCFNPVDIINNIKIWINNIPLQEDKKQKLKIMTPFYYKYTGKIESYENLESKYISYGNIINQNKSVIINELPIGISTESIKQIYESLYEKKIIGKINNYSDNNNIKINIAPAKNGMSLTYDNLKLKKYINLSNMVLFNTQNKIKKYENTSQIISEFCQKRLDIYKLRKQYQLKSYKKQIEFYTSKKTFIHLVITGKIKIFKDNLPIEHDNIKNQIVNNNIKPINDSYEHLFKINIKQFTKNHYKTLVDTLNKFQKYYDDLHKKQVKDIWLQEIEILLKML